MLRILKSYNFAFSNPLVVNQNILFSSRPGDLQSKDDFYKVGNEYIVMETSLLNWNRSNYETLKVYIFFFNIFHNINIYTF